MVNLVPQCVKCGSPVSDLVEPEIQQQGEVKPGRYIDSTWICNECLQRSNSERVEQLGKASVKDVSPNTPTADET
jgi:uncharacterized protein with PIN domain